MNSWPEPLRILKRAAGLRSNNAFGVIKGKTHGCPARDPFSFLQSEIDRLFDSFSGAGFRRPVGMQEVWPRLEVKECDGLIEVAAELPKVDEKNIEVNVTDSRLTIRGEKKPERDEKTKSYRLVERSFGTFERSIALPSGVDTSKVKAQQAQRRAACRNSQAGKFKKDSALRASSLSRGPAFASLGKSHCRGWCRDASYPTPLTCEASRFFEHAVRGLRAARLVTE